MNLDLGKIHGVEWRSDHRAFLREEHSSLSTGVDRLGNETQVDNPLRQRNIDDQSTIFEHQVLTTKRGDHQLGLIASEDGLTIDSNKVDLVR